MTNLDILPVDKYHELKSKWQNKEEFDYKFEKNSFRFYLKGRKSYHFTPGDSMDFLVSFDIADHKSGVGWAVIYDTAEIQEYDSLFRYLEKFIQQYCPEFQIVSEYQLSLF